MPSPFPGMDPFIEGQDWEDFHQGLISELAAELVPKVRPRYVVRRERRVYVEHMTDDAGRAIRGDVAVLRGPFSRAEPLLPEADSSVTPVLVSLPIPEERREAFLTIRDRDDLHVVTLVEVLSPGNKRPGSDGRSEYLRKRQEILVSDAHLVELDLLRGGDRLPTISPLPNGDYYAFVCRREHRYQAEVYAWPLDRCLPTIPIPLADPDPSVEVNLQQLVNTVYDRAGYDYSLDYHRELTPPLAEPDRDWVAKLLP